ncbi:MAG: peptidoglycan editing factor PgeF [Acidobacteria bacterium]|nr:peptidoglycan editing factor PgeF [Acidobacteriota bacterium]
MPSPERPTAPSGPLWLEVTGFPGIDGWRAGFTTRRAGGDLSAVLPILGFPELPVFRLSQLHGARVVTIGPQDTHRPPFPEGDGLATSLRGVLLAVASADCVPIALFDPERSAGAILHAGWRGTRSRIVQAGVETLRKSFGSRPESLKAMIAPSIGPCCYRVGREVLEEFRAAGHILDGLWREEGDGGFLDLPGTNRRALLDSGLDPARIYSSGLCTHCLPALFPSYRREGAGAGRILTFLGSTSAS